MWSYAFHLRLSKTINLKPNALFTLLASHEHFSFLALCAWTEEFVWINFLRSWVVLLAKKICMQSAQFKCAIKWINLSHHSAFFAYFQSIFHIKKNMYNQKKTREKNILMKRDLNLSLDTVIETLFYFYKLFFYFTIAMYTRGGYWNYYGIIVRHKSLSRAQSRERNSEERTDFWICNEKFWSLLILWVRMMSGRWWMMMMMIYLKGFLSPQYRPFSLSLSYSRNLLFDKESRDTFWKGNTSVAHSTYLKL